jgi:hypothetical protein
MVKSIQKKYNLLKRKNRILERIILELGERLPRGLSTLDTVVIKEEPISSVVSEDDEVVVIEKNPEPNIVYELIEEQEEVEEQDEVEEEVEEQEEQDEEAEQESIEEDTEVFEVTIKGVKYFTTNEKNGEIYSIDASGDVGDEVGKFVNGKAKFT